ncbi:hypothetical protein D9615_004860 [Tricholomella constricta]|uniref:RTA1-domain-containing protein n=1 Tax=Tricholomella constricta TaxID=117010 RepID=A0A8H5M723_9AGAR|nr:hypothetical protein D9615_004860 [Tricholomella constricta]
MSALDVYQDPALPSPYNYVPSRTVATIFVVLYTFSTITHIIQAMLRSRMWWLFPTICICGAVEVAGWCGRLWSSFIPSSSDAFMLQICATILAPTPLVAANFIILGRIVRKLGTAYSRLPPRWYTIVFCTCDFISLVIQGTGGGMAASSSTNPNQRKGGNVMLAGIVFQLGKSIALTIAVYACLAIEFFVRYFKDKPFSSRRDSKDPSLFGRPHMTQKLKIMSMALAFSTVCLFIRAIYRTIELSDGWSGRIISTELYFNVLDGAMVVLAIYTMNFVHPGVYLSSDDSLHSSEAINIKLREAA